MKGKYENSWIKDRYGDANKPFSELWTEEGFSCVHAEGLQGNRKYVLNVDDHESLFNENAKSVRTQLSTTDKTTILDRQGGVCNICGSKLKNSSNIPTHTFAKDRVTLEFDHRIPIDRGGENSIDNYQACLLYTSPSPRDLSTSRMPSSA